MDLVEVIAFANKNKATDLHLAPDMPPQMTVNGQLRRINVPSLTSEEITEMFSPYVSSEASHEFRVGRDGTFRFEIPGLGIITGRFEAGTIIFDTPDREEFFRSQSAYASAHEPGRTRGKPGFFNLPSILGIALVGTGLAKLVLGIDLIPEEWQFKNYSIIFLVIGFVLILPSLGNRNRS